MLITFKSDADGDVIMFGEIGQQMLETIGKDPSEPRGIITVVQLPEAVACLRAAILQDRASAELESPPEDEEEGEEEDEEAAEKRRESGPLRPEPVIRFAQRAVPLLNMLDHAERAGVVVIWES